MNKKLQKARIRLLLDEPFFGALLLNLKVIEHAGLGTMATDSVQLRYDPVFTEKLSDQELKTVLAHEALHCALLHPLRRGDRDPKNWNVACDFAINSLLVDSNDTARAKGRPEPFKLPQGGLYDPNHKGKSAETIYGEISQKPKDDPKGKGKGQGNQSGNQSQPGKPGNQTGQGQGNDADPGGMGAVEDYKAGSEAEESEQEARWKVALSQAANMAKGRGDLPGELARLIGDILEPKADWRELLRRFIRDRAKDDYSWSRPNPRYMQSGFILPSLDSQRMGKIVIARDTSGSIDMEKHEAFMGIMEAISFECKPSKIVIIDCDARIHSVREFEPGDSLPRDFSGGGGTDFRPVFDSLDDDPPVCLVYLTDLDGKFPASEPAYPTIWAATTSRQAPFGETVSLL